MKVVSTVCDINFHDCNNFKWIGSKVTVFVQDNLDFA